jgi:Bacterial CdiA-CT RNAse A domain
MSPDQAGVSIVLSAPQLAAVLSQDSVDEDASATNRLWGGLRVVGGVLELVGAGVLCVTPEPTMTSKAGCIVFGAHGADTASSGARQLWTGRDSQSLTHMGTAALAQALGANPGTADMIGLTIDIGVPLGMSTMVGAARVAAVRSGRINLIQHEALAGSRLGGHTIGKHVGRTEQQLRDRLLAEPRIPAASSFTNLQMAEQAVSKVLRMNAASIKNWAQSAASLDKLTLKQDLGVVLGSGVVRATNRLQQMTKVQVLLKLETYNGQPYYVLTAYLIP